MKKTKFTEEQMIEAVNEDFGEIEQNTADARLGLQDRLEQSAMTAAHIDNGWEFRVVVPVDERRRLHVR